jgi:ParB-like chromosome segregation protein Spo0J
MTLKKRGLGRGLEALLVDVSTKQEVPVIIKEMDEREAMAITLIETIQNENLNLLQEAEALKMLIDEFEAMVRLL